MADVSKIKLPNNSEYNIKDHRIPGVDSTPTSGSNNVITSGGVYSELNNKLSLSGGTVTGPVNFEDDININDSLDVTGTTRLQGDLFIGGWNHSGEQHVPTQTKGSFRVNGTFETVDDAKIGGTISSTGISITGEADITGSLEVGNQALINNNLTVSHGGINVTGTSYFDGTINATNHSIKGGDLTISGTSRTNGDLVTSKIKPSVTGQYDIGNSSKFYRNLYVSDIIVGDTTDSRSLIQDIENSEFVISTALNDLNSKLSNTLTGITFNNTAATVSNGIAAITATIPAAPGTLITNATTAQTASSGESMSGSITLHKVAKTGTYSDLIGTPTIPTVPVISTNIFTDKASDVKTASPKAVYDEVHPATDNSQPVGGMLPNVFYNLGTLSGNTTFSFASASDVNIENEWMFQFTTPSTAPTITWPADITGWAGDSVPTINASKTYQVSVMNGLGLIAEF